MKKYINKLILLGGLLFLGSSCETDGQLTTLKAVSFPSAIEVSSSTIVLTEDTADDQALLISWPAVTFPIAAPVTYAVQFDLVNDISGSLAWQKAKRIEVGGDVLSKAFTDQELNKIAADLGLPIDVSGQIVIRVEATMDRKIYSNPVTIKVTPYERSVVFGEIYMPGAYQGEWNVDTALALTAISKGVYQGYVTVLPGYGPVFKLNTGRNWEQYYGAGATNNDLKNMSTTDFVLPGEGSYQVKVNLNTLKWSSVAYSWGIVGDGTAGSWNTSTPMNYDYQTKTWKITADLVPGNVKFRLNNEWTINYGSKNTTDGIAYLDDQGAHYVGEAGTYEITFKINDVDPSGLGYPATANYTIVKK
ncbi:SusE-like outer membrane protein [Flavobacterium chryseum]|uniref:SusE domain-containing protein n=1 Tax=Flavobacterium sp. P3160 TaxID=2512113 RepID=UPI00105B4A4F|nr:SusE domain-containing protein [Flavobacterium sp. P3160]TDO83702.1 SusE-like outer membrane protein [Flavobacterium sp. P3160]